MNKHTLRCIAMGIAFLSAAVSAQPVRFQIGAYGVSNTPSLTANNPRWDTLPNPGDDRHRIEHPASEMDTTAWGAVRDLHLTMPLFKIRSDQVNDTFPKTNLFAEARAHGFNAAISDDSLYMNMGRSERRMYQAEDSMDFANPAIRTFPLQVPTEFSYEDRYDLHSTKRHVAGDFPNSIQCDRDGQIGCILSGFQRNNELMIGTNYILSTRMMLTGDLGGLSPGDTIIRVVLRYQHGAIDDSISRAFTFSDFPAMPDSVVELNVGCFRIDTTVAEYPMRYRLRDMGDTLTPSYIKSNRLTSDTARHFDGFELEVWNHAHA